MNFEIVGLILSLSSFLFVFWWEVTGGRRVILFLAPYICMAFALAAYHLSGRDIDLLTGSIFVGMVLALQILILVFDQPSR